MEFNQFLTILLSTVTLSIGIIFGVLRNKILSQTENSNLISVFYIFSLILFTLPIYAGFKYYDEIFHNTNLYGIIIFFTSIIVAIGFFVISKKLLIFKNNFNIIEIDPVINNFTENADKNEIKLFGGDLNFFGMGPSDMDANKQYTCLKTAGFTIVKILCTEPQNSTDNIRYGKILNDFKNIEIRYYDPKNADLYIRGRLKTIQGVTRLLIYTKVKKGLYRIIETDTANSSGALYNNIWDLAWSLAKQQSIKEISYLKNL